MSPFVNLRTRLVKHFRLVTHLEFFKIQKLLKNLLKRSTKSCRLVTLSRIVTHFCYGQKVRRFAKGD